MELRLLRYFLEVANEGNITRASAKLHITQPSLSRQIAHLESELGRKLYYRESSGIRLTEEGILLKKRTEEILDLVAKTRDELSESSKTITGTIHIAAGETAGIRHVARILRRMREDYPAVRYRMISGDYEDVADKLDKCLSDFGLFVGKVSLSKYECITLPYADLWGALVRADDPLAGRQFITPQDLQGRELLFSHQAKTHGEFSEWLGYPAEALNIIGTHNLAFNASLMVREGLGILITLEGIVNAEGLKFIPLRPELKAALVLAWRKEAVLSRAARKFLELAQNCEAHCLLS